MKISLRIFCVVVFALQIHTVQPKLEVTRICTVPATVTGRSEIDFNSWLAIQTDWGSLENGLRANLPSSEKMHAASETANIKADLVQFHLYTDPLTRFSPDQLIYNNSVSLTASRFNSSNPVKFFIHGFGHGYNCSFAQDIKDIYLANDFNLNSIIVDWRDLAGDFTIAANSVASLTQSSQALLSYYRAVKNTEIVGQRLGDMIKFLVDEGVTRLESIHVVGFSLGAQVGGHAGRRVISTMRCQLPRISGLDPAGPLFQTGKIGNHLSKSDASFVDFYHTDMGQSGTEQSLGHYNFYVNSGTAPQPSCLEYYFSSPTVSVFIGKLPYALTGTCSHSAAPLYYAQSIQGKNIGVKECFTGHETLIQQLSSVYCLKSSSVVFGDNSQRLPNSKRTSGYYYVRLNPVPASEIYSC